MILFGKEFVVMRTMTTLAAFLCLWGVNSWGQNCQIHGEVFFTNTICPCTGRQTSLQTCQANGQGTGCEDFVFQNFCGTTCSIGMASGCIGGPKTKVISFSGPFEREIKTRFAKESHVAVLTCSNDNGAFERWLLATGPARNIHSARGIGN